MSIIRYDVMDALDPVGNTISGYVDIESVPTSDSSKGKNYSISHYIFQSDTGMVSGESGLLTLACFSDGRYDMGDSAAMFHTPHAENTLGLLNVDHWQFQWSISLYNKDGSNISVYTDLPYEIRLGVVDSQVYPGTERAQYWGLAYNGTNFMKYTLRKRSGPCACALLSSGLKGLAVFKKKLKK